MIDSKRSATPISTVLRDLGGHAVVVTGNRIEAALPPRAVTSADVVAALVDGGARVTGVSAAEESLEDAYLSTLRDMT